MKIGIYGGSFNPIHYGHLGLVKWIINNTDLDQIWLMVSPNNPLKDKSILANENDRLKNVKLTLSLENDDRLVASDFQFNLPKPNLI
jgi:nicotinate-nucleotide adenylyltransferase